MTIVKVNHKEHKNAFFFQALFSAIILSCGFYLNDWLDHIIKEKVHGHNKKHIKAAIHMGVIFVITFIIIYLLYYLFGWGNTFLG